MTHLLALDQGTTSSRALLVNEAGVIEAVEQQEFRQHYPQPGWVEHDPEEIWTSQIEVARQALHQAGLTASDVAAVGIANQRETIVLWHRATGKPLHNAIVWQDCRTADVCQRLRGDGRDAMIREKTGLLADPYFSATKIGWLLDHVPDARKAAEQGELACGTVDCWLTYRLSGGALHLTDASNAARTSLMNIHTGQWDEELLECFGVPREILPEIRPSSQVFGEIDSQHPIAGVPLAGLAGDQQAALFGQACFQPGLAKNTYGTGCFLLMHTGQQAVRSEHQLLTTIACGPPGSTQYALEGSVFIGGAVVSWLRDGLGVIKSSAEIEQLAASVPDSGGVFLVPAFAGLGAPHWDPYARGAILGITRGTTAAHFARAAIESIALQVADVIDAMQRDLHEELSELRVDGGASVNDGLLQFQADMLQTPVVRPSATETTALGAAYLAGLAVGVWSNRDEIASQWQVEKRFEPSLPAEQAAEHRARWRQAVQRSLDWAHE